MARRYGHPTAWSRPALAVAAAISPAIRRFSAAMNIAYGGMHSPRAAVARRSARSLRLIYEIPKPATALHCGELDLEAVDRLRRDREQLPFRQHPHAHRLGDRVELGDQIRQAGAVRELGE